MLVLNKLDRKSGIQPASVEETLKHPVKGQILSDEKTVLAGINSGVPFMLGPKTALPVQGVMELAAKLKEEFAPKEEAAEDKKRVPGKTGLFQRR